MHSRVRIALVVLLTLLVALPVLAETYTVDGARGDDTNDGIAAPFKTIARGVNATMPGDTLRIVPMDEPYAESLNLRRNGLRGAPITVDGGGATLTGADAAPTEGWTEQDGIWQVPLQAHKRMMVFGPDRHFFKGAGPTNLEPEQWLWEDGTFYFRPAEGNTPADYALRLSTSRASGVITTGAGLIIVRNITCINFWNDGFNLHGGSGPLWFENIVGNWNGDEGFSAHENAECYVRGAEFSNNYWHGINDIIYSRTHFVDIICRDNRSKGVRFNGGMHSLTDCEVSGSPINVELLPYSTTNFPHSEEHPLAVSFTNIRNTVVRSTEDEVGIYVGANSEAVVEHCLLLGGAPVVSVQPTGKAFVVNSIVSGGVAQEVASAGEFIGDNNLYSPGRFLIAGTEYAPDAFADYRAASGNDENSVIAEPIFAEDGLTLAADSPGYRSADSGAYGGFAIGIEDRARAVASSAAAGVSIAQGDTEELAGGGTRIVYDFEEVNPWSRIYPVPEASQGGIAVAGTSELSEEQAHGGTKSAKVSVVTAEGQPGSYTIKLFSQYLPFDQPVRKFSYWLYGDGSGRSARPRIRDGNGEGFYGASVRIDWEGWQQITWDLDEAPPTTIAGGNNNKRQDGPTMELVLEIDQPAASEMTLFLDDLDVELAPEGWTTPTPAGQAAQPAQPGQPAQPVQPAAPVLMGETQGEQMTFDFETENPWSRTFPEPAEVGGVAVAATSELSTEQAHGGTHSAKVTMTAPAAANQSIALKLFTEDIATGVPINGLSVWVYSEARRGFNVRIRDNRGENFYGPSSTHPGGGWQELTWDLKSTPPDNIAGGNENKVQDPPLEFVLTTAIKPQEGEAELVYYVDDLTLTLGESGAAPAPTPQAQAPAADRPDDYVAINLPEVDAPAPEGQTEALAGGGTRYSWDFEASNPWNRIYPAPDKNQAGAMLGGVAELSGEQAHSGDSSGKVLVQVPPSPPGGFDVKLFSARFQFFSKPIRRIAFWVYTDGPLSYKLRVRDGKAEGFWSSARKLTGTGWQQVEWDLQADPPEVVRGGDDNGVQNGPPMEIVMEYGVRAGAGWTTHTIYVDDLEVDLEG